MPFEFMGKTWIFAAQAIMIGGFGLFSLMLGPLFLLGFLKKADGTPATDAGVALTTMSVPLLLVFALAVYNLRVRRLPILRLCREGIEFHQIGASSLDGVPFVPGLARVAWLICSTQGFRKRVFRIPWAYFQDAWVSGLPMSRTLTIVASPDLTATHEIPADYWYAWRLVLPEARFRAPLDEIAQAIQSYADSTAERCGLPSWNRRTSEF